MEFKCANFFMIEASSRMQRFPRHLNLTSLEIRCRLPATPRMRN